MVSMTLKVLYCILHSLQVSYAIGVPEPLSVHVDTYGTAKEGVHDKQILAAVKKAFDFRPGTGCRAPNNVHAAVAWGLHEMARAQCL